MVKKSNEGFSSQEEDDEETTHTKMSFDCSLSDRMKWVEEKPTEREKQNNGGKKNLSFFASLCHTNIDLRCSI